MQNKATDLFSDWAEVGRDKGMADAHDPAVTEILDNILKDQKTPFTFTKKFLSTRKFEMTDLSGSSTFCK